MDKQINFSKTVTIYSSSKVVWEVLLSEELYQTAWGARLTTSWKPGSDIRFSGTWEGIEYSDKGVVLINEGYNHLKYSYWSSFWDVTDDPEEYCFISYKVHAVDSMTCECTITQDGFRDQKHYEDTVELLLKTLAIIKCESERLELASFCENVFDRMISRMDSIHADLYNKPVANGWSPGQIVEHVIMSSSGMEQFLGEATPSSTPYDSNIPGIRTMMLNTTQKLKTPDPLVPPFMIFEREQQKQKLVAISHELTRCINTLDFGKKCESDPMPPFGNMSVFEWLTFTVFHISRHTSQLEG